MPLEGCRSSAASTVAMTAATTTATATAALNFLRVLEDERPHKKRKMAGRPRKHSRPEDAASAKLASNRATYHRRREGLSSRRAQFVLYEPIQADAPPITCDATGIRSDINTLPRDDSVPQETPQQAIIVSQSSPGTQVPLSAPPLVPQRAEEDDVEATISQLNLRDEVDLEYEAAITLHILQSGGNKSQESNAFPFVTRYRLLI